MMVKGYLESQKVELNMLSFAYWVAHFEPELYTEFLKWSEDQYEVS